MISGYTRLFPVTVGRTQIIQNGLSYTDMSGKVNCGILHEDGSERKRQTCKAISANGNCHHINPYRTKRERQLLKKFELDHE